MSRQNGGEAQFIVQPHGLSTPDDAIGRIAAKLDVAVASANDLAAAKPYGDISGREARDDADASGPLMLFPIPNQQPTTSDGA